MVNGFLVERVQELSGSNGRETGPGMVKPL
jgi:hypothetical protein